MMHFLIFLLITLGFGIIMTVLPGPITLLYIENVLQKHISAAAACVIGLFSAEFIYLFITLLGYHLYLIQHPLIFNFISFLGACAILAMGLKNVFFSKNIVLPIGEQSSETECLHKNFTRFFKIAFFVTLLNPSILLMFMFMLNFYHTYYQGYLSVLAFMLIFESGSILGTVCIGFLLFKLEASSKVLYRMKKMIGIFFILFALFTIIKLIRTTMVLI